MSPEWQRSSGRCQGRANVSLAMETTNNDKQTKTAAWEARKWGWASSAPSTRLWVVVVAGHHSHACSSCRACLGNLPASLYMSNKCIFLMFFLFPVDFFSFLSLLFLLSVSFPEKSICPWSPSQAYLVSFPTSLDAGSPLLTS